jgi:hypothetical protein
MADLRAHHHTMRGSRPHEIETRVCLRYPKALTILVRPKDEEGPSLSDSPSGADLDYLLLAFFQPSA